jgi:23S rRNA pseudouridine1911/1915/1917 synthase
MPKDLSEIVDKVVFKVDAEDAGARLDHFLADKVGWRSRTELQERIKSGTVTLNGAPAKVSQRVRKGDAVVIAVAPRDVGDQDPGAIALEILYEDDAIVVLAKQAGLVVHPTGIHVYDTLMSALWLRYRETPGAGEPHVVHRLDRNTSGVIAVARTAAAKQALQRQFEKRAPKKSYLAICDGVVETAGGEIDAPLARDSRSEIKLKMCVDPGGAPSRTSYEVIERFARHTLVRARPLTGRQHQIRVHLGSIGHPVLCDPLYGDPRSLGTAGGLEILARQALHAESLEIEHPSTRELMVFTAPLTPDMGALLDALRRGERILHLGDQQSARWRVKRIDD